MNKKPIAFYFLTMFFIFIAVAMPTQIAYIFEYRVEDINKIFHKLTNLNYVIMGLCFLNAFLAFKTNKYLKIALPVTALLIGFNNYFVSKYGTDFSYLHTTLASFSFALIPLFTLMPNGFYVLDNPSRCHWIPAKRMRSKEKLLIKGRLGIYLRGQSVNISSSGMFVNLKSQDKGTLRVGEKINLEFLLPKSANINCRGKVVRKINFDKGTSLAIKFEEFSLRRMFYLFRLQYSPIALRK